VCDPIPDCRLVGTQPAAHKRTLEQPLHDLSAGVRLIRRQLSSKRVAVLFGSEKRVLSNQDLSHCHWLLRIPTREDHGSMNLGQAVAVCLYEIIRGTKAPVGSDKQVPATAAEVERVTEILLEAARASGYLTPRASAATQDKVRRLVRRMNIQAEDAEIWMGMLRQLLWKMKSAG